MNGQNRQKLAILAKLYDYQGDITKPWFVFYSVRNAATGRMERFKVHRGLGVNVRSAKIRRSHAEKLINEINAKLQTGWTPYDDVNVIYDDSLRYADPILQYKRKRGKNRTWHHTMSAFLTEKKLSTRKGTWQTYQSKFRIFDQWLDKMGYHDNDITVLDYDDVKKFLLYLLEKRKLTGKGINEYIRLFRNMSKQLINEGKLKKDPWEKCEKMKLHSQSPMIFSDEMIKKIREKALEMDPQLWIICRFIFYCFIRPRELRFLKIKNIDWNSGMVTVPGDIAKNHKTQSVVIPDHFLQELKEMGYDQMNPEFYLFSVSKHPDVNPVGKNYMFNHFDKIRKDLNISKEYKFYGWKHSGGVSLKKSGIDIIDIKNQFRHHSLDELFNYLCSLEGAASEKIRYHGPKI